MIPEPHSPATISDVAKKAGVSTASVSSVINGKSRVSAATEARILAAIDSLGFHINPSARQLRTGKTGAIGLVVPELNRPYFGQLATHLADLLEQEGKHLVMQRSGGSKEQELAAASFARLRMYDGVIISVVDVDPHELERLGFATPVVLLGERSSNNTFDHVAMDNVGGARQAVAHLLERGAKRIVLLGGSLDAGIEMSQLRTRGYVEEHAAVGHDVDESLVVPLDLYDLESGRAAIHMLVSTGVEFDAIFAITDVVALGALRALAELNLRVPHEVQVIGFDSISESEYSTPALTSVDPNKAEIAKTVLELLGTRLEGGGNTPHEVIIPTRLIARETTLP